MTKHSKRNEWLDILAGAAEWRGTSQPQSARAWYQVLVSYGHHLKANRNSVPNQLRNATLRKVISALIWAEESGMADRTPRGDSQDVDMYAWAFHVEQEAEDAPLMEPASEPEGDDDEDGAAPGPVVWF